MWFDQSGTQRSPTPWRSWRWWRRNVWRSRSSERTSTLSLSSFLQPSLTALWQLWSVSHGWYHNRREPDGSYLINQTQTQKPLGDGYFGIYCLISKGFQHTPGVSAGTDFMPVSILNVFGFIRGLAGSSVMTWKAADCVEEAQNLRAETVLWCRKERNKNTNQQNQHISIKFYNPSVNTVHPGYYIHRTVKPIIPIILWHS